VPGGNLRVFVLIGDFHNGCGHAMEEMIINDIEFMKKALSLAKWGQGRVSPNPMVGALVVKDNQVVGRGYHKRAGTEHAETLALREAGNLANGATLYVTLEPCAHYANTPPCVRDIIRAGIRRVVAAMVDPNPIVNGKGFSVLKDAGIEVEIGVLEEEVRKLNEVYIKSITTGLPFAVMKYAMTMDGKIAAHTGDSKWITSESARRFVHELRNIYDAVVVGVGTVLADNPKLTVRDLDGAFRNPVRIIVDSHLRTPLDSNVLTEPGRIIMVATEKAPIEKIKEFEARGIEILITKEHKGRVDLQELCKGFVKQRITSLLLEGGGNLNASFLEQELVDKVLCFVAPRIIGGERAITPVEGKGIGMMKDSLMLQNVSVSKIGQDVLIEGYLKG
jgi:diaminohydroxyphosphoribosylaminopyrimidine deaminase/5-amino-6-(5-phosphoribosylamino)uracil reductase